MVARSGQEAAEALAGWSRGAEPAGVVQGSNMQARAKLAFLFTGQGSQYAGMGKGLYERHAVFRQALDECDAIVQRLQGWSILAAVYDAEASGIDLMQTAYAQPALFAVEYALARLWQWHGVQPDCVAGHSLGEYVAACIAGVFSLEDALMLVAERGRLTQSMPPGAMVAVHADPALIADLFERCSPQATHGVCVAAHNSAHEMVLAGTEEALKAFVLNLQPQGASFSWLRVHHAFHSPLLLGMVDEFKRCAETVSFHPPRMALVSSLSGELAGAEVATAAYWVRHTLEPVLFARSLQSLLAHGCRRFIEVGPHPVLTALGRQQAIDASWAHSLRRGADDEFQFQLGLSAYHVAGGAVDWQQCMQARQRLTLPLYPFATERHWFARRAALEAPLDADLHPLAGRPLVLAGSAQRYFENRFSASHWLFDQHRVLGVATMPATAMIEWALAALARATGSHESDWVLHPIEFKRVLDVEDDAAVQVQLLIEPQGEGYRIAGFSRTGPEDAPQWNEHLNACAMPAPEAGMRPPMSLERLRAGLSAVPVEGCYDAFHERGLGYGEGFRGLVQCWRGRRVMARVELPDSLPRFFVNPAVLDACLHSLLLVDDIADSGSVCVPVAVQRVQVLRRLPVRLWCEAELHGEFGAGGMADLSLYDDEGQCVATLQGLQFARVPRELLERAPATAAESIGHALGWEPIAMDLAAKGDGKNDGKDRDAWLIDCADPREAEAWRAAFEAVGEEAVLEAPPTRKLRGLVLVGGAVQSDANEAVFETAERGFRVLQRFLAAHADEQPEILICTRGVHAVSERDAVHEVALADSSLHALAKTVIAEYPHLKCVHLDLDPEGPACPARELLAAARSQAGCGHLALRGAKLHEARLRTYALDADCSKWRVRPDASYLITGGLGGLGLAVAQWLVAQGARHLALVGRRDVDERADAVAALRRAGVQVITMQADVSREEDVARVLQALQTNGAVPLRGVIHAAGLLDDTLLAGLDWPRVRSVMEPKVRGAWHLHRLTRELPLDFFVLFSSMVSMIGSAGQANHMMGNAYLDALVHHRRSQGLCASSINWGLWGEVGIAAQPALLERHAQAGIRGLSTAEGMNALHAVLAAAAVQVAVIPIDWPSYAAARPRRLPYTLMAERINQASVPSPVVDEPPRVELSGLAPHDAKRAIEELLFERSMRVLRLDASRQAELRGSFAGTRLNMLGLDSLMAVELRHRLRVDCAVDVPVQHLIGGSTAAEVVDHVYAQVMVRQLTASAVDVQEENTERETWML